MTANRRRRQARSTAALADERQLNPNDKRERQRQRRVVGTDGGEQEKHAHEEAEGQQDCEDGKAGAAGIRRPELVGELPRKFARITEVGAWVAGEVILELRRIRRRRRA